METTEKAVAEQDSAETLEELTARVDKVALAGYDHYKRLAALDASIASLEEAADAYREEIDHLKRDKELLAGILTRVVQAVGEAGLLEDI